jgi:hypothetical protein
VKSLAPLLIAVVTAGCTTTHVIERSVPGDLELLDDRMRGRQATVALVDGTREQGVVLFVRADSAAWRQLLVRHAVPMEQVARMTRHRDKRSIRRGLLTGLAVGAAFAVPALLRGDRFPFDAELTAANSLLGFAAWGLVLGSLSGRERVYVLRP